MTAEWDTEDAAVAARYARRDRAMFTALAGLVTAVVVAVILCGAA
jgi:hypothetical protein